MKKQNTIKAIIIYLLIAEVAAVSVGTAPGVYDLGELDPGQNVAFRFYLITNSKNDMLVTLGYVPPHQDIFKKRETSRYMFIPEEASQEDISSWIEIPRNPLLLSPARTKVVYLSGGGVVKANEEADIILRIPENADPGYHVGSIGISPKLVTQGRGTGVTTIAVTRFVFFFRVSGKAERKGEVTTIIGDRIAENEAKIDVLFKNTGTCTLSAYVSELKLYDKFGEHVATLKSGMSLVRPNMIAPLSTFWVGDKVKPGTYRAEVKVDYITSYVTAEGTVEIPTTIKKPITPTKKEAGISLCNIMPQLLVALIILALLIYWLDWRHKEAAFIILGAIFLIALIIFLLTCVFAVAFSWLDVVFLIIIIALIIYWRLS